MADPRQQPKNKPAEPYDYRPLMDSVLNHNVGSTLMGTVVGGPMGGVLANAASRIWPQASSQLNHAVANHTILPAIGRIVTNLTEPDNYENKSKELYETVVGHPLDSLRHVLGDTRMDRRGKRHYSEELHGVGDTPVRAAFGLPPREGGLVYKKNSDGTFAVDGETQATFDKSMEGASKYVADPDEKGRYTVSTGLTGTTTLTPAIPTADELVGNRDPYTFRDPWDFGLRRGEKADSVTNVLRHGIDKLTSPNTMVFSGRVTAPAGPSLPPRPAESVSAWPSLSPQELLPKRYNPGGYARNPLPQ